MRSFALLSILLLACTGDDAGPDTDEVEVADGKADGEIRVRIDGLTVWIDPLLARADGARPWRLGGRASRNLTTVHGFVPDDAFGEVTVRSARTFEIALDDHELNTIVSGMPLFLSITPASGEPASAAVWLAPRLGAFSGTSKLRLDSTVTPRWVAGDVIYRGGARAEPGWFMTGVGDDAPQVFAAAEPDRFRIDIPFGKLAVGTTTPFVFQVQNADQIGRKQGLAQLATRRLGLTRLDPAEVWQQRCESKVNLCLQGLPAGTVDAGTCGTYRQVEACGGLALGEVPANARVVADLRAFLVEFYDGNPDIIANGGNSLAQAQAAVDPTKLELIVDAVEDPAGHDLGTFWVFSHPDVTFPGSDTRWYAAYAKATGSLVEIYDFN